MSVGFGHRSDFDDSIVYSYLSILWEILIDVYRCNSGETHSTLNAYRSSERRRRVKCMCISFVLIMTTSFFFVVGLVAFTLLSRRAHFVEIEAVQHGGEISATDNADEPYNRFIYIDIGCFNAETVEYFLHFTENSARYEIYTFEPDPDNYRLCKKRLSSPRFAKYNINIIRKVAWTRDETVYFQTERGRQSRISVNATENDDESTALEAIDFSSWLAELVGAQKAKVHIKMSMPGAEVAVLEKMVFDDTLKLANKYEVEWTDRANPKIRATRIYIQLMFDTYGFDCLYYTRLQNIRKVYQAKGMAADISKYYDWQKISESDALAHYMQRQNVLSSKDRQEAEMHH